MSRYITEISTAIVHALASVPSAQPAQVAGYWENREFWLSEFEHLRTVIDGYESRLARMQTAFERHIQAHGGPHNRDEFGVPRQHPVKTTNSNLKFSASEARSTLKRLADRALDLKITSYDEYDRFIASLRITQ
jgi:hypothetical protein